MTPSAPLDHAGHDLDALSEALDGRLSGESFEAVHERVRNCTDCRAAYEAMAWARGQAARLPAPAFPPDLEEGLRARLEQERARRGWTGRRALAASIAAALLVAVAALVLRQASAPPTLPRAVADDYERRVAARIPPAYATAEPTKLEASLAAAGLGFPVRVFDLGMMGYELRGGALDAVGGRRGVLIVYREAASGREVFCRMLPGGLADLPAPDAEREHDGIPFRLYRAEGLTLVFWPEGDVLCVLVGPGDPEALVGLAFAKAMKARPRES